MSNQTDSDSKLNEAELLQREQVLKNQQDILACQRNAPKIQHEVLDTQRQKHALDLQGVNDATDLIQSKNALDIQRNKDIADLQRDRDQLEADKRAFEIRVQMLEAKLDCLFSTHSKGSLYLETGSKLEENDSFGIVDGERREETGVVNDEETMTKFQKMIQAQIDHNQSLLDKLQIKSKQLKVLSTRLQEDKDRHYAAVTADRKSLEEEREELYAELAASHQAILNRRLNIPHDTSLVELSNRLNKRAAAIEKMRSCRLVTQDEFNYLVLEMTDDDFAQLKSRFTSRWPIIKFIKSKQPMANDQAILYARVMNDDEFLATGFAHKKNTLVPLFGDDMSSTLPPTFINHLITMPDTEFKSRTKHLKFIKWTLSKSPGSLDAAQLHALVSLSEAELVTRQDYREYHDRTCLLRDSVITPCSTNFSEWGTSKDWFGSIEGRFPCLDKSILWMPEPYFNLLDCLYPRDEATGKKRQRHTHPNDPSIAKAEPPLFPSCLRSHLDDGSIPRLSSNPKLFFSTRYIANGEWIQFHGPGTEIFDVGGSGFHLVVGCLCPKGKGGNFRFIDSDDGHTYTTNYQISIKWE